jgi:prepilin-type N-terminal cleavage/methylation domain-containing protein
MRRFSLNQAGDTIIEVMVAVAILALVLTVAYQSTSRSLQSGVDSSNRQQAIALASQQIEIIKNAETSPQGEPALNAYHAAGAFCIDGTKLDNSNYGRSQNIFACHSVNNSV